MINFEEFKKTKMRVGEIKEVSEVPGADSLYKIIVDLGSEKRQVLAGIKKYYEKEDLLNKKVVVVANLEEKEMFGEVSQGMILAAGEEPALITVDEDVENGAEVK